MLRDHFKPEFLNRIDDIVVFRQLSKDQIAKIIDVQLEKLRKTLEERGITIELDDSARDLHRSGRLRSGLRGSAAETGDPDAGPESAGSQSAQGRDRKRQHRQSVGEGRRDEIHAG